jgi:phosphohistidine phosphatase
MKTLYILRHAKAERDSDSGLDFDRPLAERGWSDAELVGREARRRDVQPDAALSSPARRAAETVAAVARGFGEIEPSFEPGIYEASVRRLMDMVAVTDDAVRRLLIVGHNPGFEGLVRTLAADLPEALADGFPTAALAVLDLPIEQWSDLGERSAEVTALIVPRDLR